MAILIWILKLKTTPGFPRFYTLKTLALTPSAVFSAGWELKQKKIQTSSILKKRRLYGIFILRSSVYSEPQIQNYLQNGAVSERIYLQSCFLTVYSLFKDICFEGLWYFLLRALS